MGESFADSNVNTVYPCVRWLVEVYKVSISIATRNAGTQELKGEDAEGGVSSPGLGHEAFAGVVPISGDEKTAVFVYEVGPGEGVNSKKLVSETADIDKSKKNLQESTSDIIF